MLYTLNNSNFILPKKISSAFFFFLKKHLLLFKCYCQYFQSDKIEMLNVLCGEQNYKKYFIHESYIKLIGAHFTNQNSKLNELLSLVFREI